MTLLRALGKAVNDVADSPKAWLTARALALIFVVFFALQLHIYHEAVYVQPVGDDYILPLQIRLGEQVGPWRFFDSSPLQDYRPLQSVLFWAVGRWSIENPFGLAHILNFVSFGFYVLAFALWLQQTHLPMIGVLGATGVLLLHPILAGPLAGLDGFTRFVVSGWVWLGAYFAFRYADRLRLAIPLVTSCFVIGLGFMEYAVALVPLSLLAMWCGRRHERVRGIAALSATLLVLSTGYYFLRVSIIGPDPGNLSASPVTWMRNFALLAISVLFMGNTVSIYVNQTIGSLITLGIAIPVMVFLVLGGLWSWRRNRVRLADVDQAEQTTQKVFVFLAPAFFASFVPMIFMKHVSEIYVSAIVIPFALQTGYAAVGWWKGGRPYFIAFLLVFATHLAWAYTSVTSKVASLRETGERASTQLQDLMKWIPNEAQDLRVALIFLESTLHPRRTYSVFRVGDDRLISRSAIRWVRPGKNIQVRILVVQHRSQIDPGAFDVVLYWNPMIKRFEPWKL